MDEKWLSNGEFSSIDRLERRQPGQIFAYAALMWSSALSAKHTYMTMTASLTWAMRDY